MTRLRQLALLFTTAGCATTLPPPGRMEATPAVAVQATEHSVEGAFTYGVLPTGGGSYTFALKKFPLAIDVHGQGSERSANGGVGVWFRRFPSDKGLSFGTRIGWVAGGGTMELTPRFEPLFIGSNVTVQLAHAPPTWGGSWSASVRAEYIAPAVDFYAGAAPTTSSEDATAAVIPGIWTSLDLRCNIPIGKRSPVRLATGLGVHTVVFVVPFPFATVGLQGNFGQQVGRDE